jgi:hypothetical protein
MLSTTPLRQRYEPVLTYEWEGLPDHVSLERAIFEDHDRETKVTAISPFFRASRTATVCCRVAWNRVATIRRVGWKSC